MPKALRFKGDKKPKRRKRVAAEGADSGDDTGMNKPSTALSKKAYDSDDEGWIDSEALEDFTGPLLFCIATTPPSALSSDATGAVFGSALSEIEGENLSTAEPAQVQQVWVCAKIYGSTTPKYSLRAHTGKYLGCDAHGVLSATREAISAEEEWVPIPQPGSGRWAWQTVRGGFIGVEEKEGKGTVVRGDREDVGFRETWTVRLQKRNKVKVKAGGGDAGKIKDRVTKKELEELVGVSLDDEQVKKLRKARKEGGFHEALLDIRVKHGKHDKFAY